MTPLPEIRFPEFVWIWNRLNNHTTPAHHLRIECYSVKPKHAQLLSLRPNFETHAGITARIGMDTIVAHLSAVAVITPPASGNRAPMISVALKTSARKFSAPLKSSHSDMSIGR